MNNEEIVPVRQLKKNHTSLTGRVSDPLGSLHSFESSLERDFIIITNFNVNVEKFVEQPLRIDYQDVDGRKRHYTPDFLVFYKNEIEDHAHYKPSLIEIKYQKKLSDDWDILKPKFDAAKEYSEERGWEFRVITEREIRTDFLFNAKFLSGYLNSEEVKIETIGFLLNEINKRDEISPYDLVELCSSDLVEKGHFLYTIWHMVATHMINVDLSKKLTMKSIIWSKI